MLCPLCRASGAAAGAPASVLGKRVLSRADKAGSPSGQRRCRCSWDESTQPIQKMNLVENNAQLSTTHVALTGFNQLNSLRFLSDCINQAVIGMC